MTRRVPPVAASDDGTNRPPLRLLPSLAPPATHPLTTPSAPLLPSREVVGRDADIWEELDRAAVWVYDETCAGRLALDGYVAGLEGGPERLRHSLRLLCVAARSAWATVGSVDKSRVIRSEDLPGPVPPGVLVSALRRRLVAQTMAARDRGEPAADPAEVLRALAALDRVDASLAADGVRRAMDQLTGATAMDLLVEVAHDMRSPLGSILFLVERLRDVAGPTRSDAENRQLALVYGAAFGLGAMVSDVMELARGGDRLAAGEPGPFVVADTLSAVRSIVAPLAEEKGLTLDVAELPRGVRIGHGAALHRVLVNLVTNALKFTPSGEVSVRVDGRSPTRLAFTVRDTGRGIPPRVLAQLFHTFRRRGSSDDYGFSSAGLGLAICQKLLTAMGSALEVASVEGQGTTFRFELELPPTD